MAISTRDLKYIVIGEKQVARMWVTDDSGTTEEVALMCKITYDANGCTSGTAPASQEGYWSQTITLQTNTGNLEKTHYEFIGWNTAADGSGTTYSAGGSYTLAGDVTLYACWRVQFVVTFNLNILTSGTGYYLSSGSFPNGNPSTPATRYLNQGSAVGTLPSIGNNTYRVAPGGSYTTRDWTTYVSGWYMETSCTNAVSASTVPTGNVTYYAKWVISGSVTLDRNATAGGVYYLLPKFIKKIVREYARGGGGASGSTSTCDADPVSTEVCEVAICGSGGWGAVADQTYNRAISGGNQIYLYAGAGGTTGGGGASYVNLDGTRLETGNGGGVGTSSSNRYNLYDTSPEKNICDYSYSPCITLQICYKGSTKIVSGHSRVGDISFQYYGTANVKNKNTPINIRFYLDGSSTVWTSRSTVGYYYNDSEGDIHQKVGNSHNTTVRRGTPSGAGCPGYGGYAISTGSDRSLTQQAGIAGRAFVTVSS
jgi:hypothetical protein